MGKAHGTFLIVLIHSRTRRPSRSEENAEKSWYKVGREDIPVVGQAGSRKVKTLSKYSSFVAGMKPIRKVMVYVRPEDAEGARQELKKSWRDA